MLRTNKKLFSKRISYQPFHECETSQLVANMSQLLSQPINTTYFWDGKPWDEDKVTHFITDSVEHWEKHEYFGVCAAFETASNSFMGYLDLHQTDEYAGHPNAVEIGYIIDDSFKGNKYGLEMANFGYQYMEEIVSSAKEIGITTLPKEMVATVAPGNIPSIKILENTLINQEARIFHKALYGQDRILFFRPFTIQEKQVDNLFMLSL